MTFTTLTGYTTPSLEHTFGGIQIRGLSEAAQFVITLSEPFVWYWTRGANVAYSDRFALYFDTDPTPTYAVRLERGSGTNFILIPTLLPGGAVEIDAGKCAVVGYEPEDEVNVTLTATPGGATIDFTVPTDWTWTV